MSGVQRTLNVYIKRNINVAAEHKDMTPAQRHTIYMRAYRAKLNTNHTRGRPVGSKNKKRRN